MSDERLTEDEPDWERRRRLARIFGDVLPDTTRDEKDDPETTERGTDAWLRAQVPPHHGS
ncbi:hypothetical protein [Nocardioides sp. CER19]|uniref:hypothetical protein n=1 Tax=Nocardioides sp. CER19 TaxID=3038538 RepID=UPI0024498C0A|nr:hypothetical protein [Nocardioides sp. CER19]MDH2414664.1 hypothetical protein [Nocardioides sp. CER19]